MENLGSSQYQKGFTMRRILLITIFFTVVCGIFACNKIAENKQAGEKPAVDIAPQRAQLQKAKELERKIQQDAEDQRKVIELQTNPNN